VGKKLERKREKQKGGSKSSKQQEHAKQQQQRQQQMDVNTGAIVLSFSINLLKRYSSKISSQILTKFNGSRSSTNELSELNEEMRNLVKERDTFNPMDEFAKYALVNRKINKLSEKIKEIKNKLTAERMKKLMYLNAFFTILILVASVNLIWFNYDRPVIDFSNVLRRQEDSLESTSNSINATSGESSSSDFNIFFPINRLLSFPCTNRPNSIGVTAWLFIVNRFIDITVNKLNINFLKQ
jgi:hypothetical protein